jgi:glycosyltransferase involved in cell wall biosynthesis
MQKELTRRGHRVSIFTGTLTEPSDGVYLVRSSLTYRARAWFESRRGVSGSSVLHWGEVYAGAVLEVHRQHPIDVIEMEESFGWPADVVSGTSIPTVVKLHGPAFMTLIDEEMNSPLARTKIEREGDALRQVKVLTAPALHTLEAATERYGLTPAVRRHVVNPLSLPPSAPLWNLNRCDRNTLLFVGRFDKLKGGDIVMRAFARLLTANPGLKLIFVGPDAGLFATDGTRLRFNEFKSTLFAGDAAASVDYRGKLTPEVIYDLRAHALLTIVASRWENQSYTALEAMLQGCPLVSSDAGGQGEIIADGVTGLLAAAGSVDDLSAKIQALIDDPERAAALGRRAREYVLTHHAPSRVAADMLAVYEEAIAIAKPQRGRRKVFAAASR